MLREAKSTQKLTPHNEHKTNTTRGKKDSETYPSTMRARSLQRSESRLRIDWPSLVKEEYTCFIENRRCMNAERLNKVFGFVGNAKLRKELPPVFFAGHVGKRQFCLLSLNPHYDKWSSKKECEKLNELGWEKAWLTFFTWFHEARIGSRYYSRFAVFLSGLLGRKEIPKKREERDRLLSENLVNLDLIPYHSVRTNISLIDEKRREAVEPYLENLGKLIESSNPKVLFINGAAFKPILEETPIDKAMRFIRSQPPAFVPVNEHLTAHLGSCFGRKTIWFDKFMTCRAAHPSNKDLHLAGNELNKLLKL